MQTILDLLARNAVAATLLAVAVLLATTVIRRPAIRNALWLIVLVRFVMPPIWSVPVLSRDEAPLDAGVISPVLSVPVPAEAKVNPTASAELAPPPRWIPLVTGNRDYPPTPIADNPETMPTPLPAAAHIDPRVEVAAVASSEPRWSRFWIPVIFAVWLTGTLAVLALAIIRIGRFHLALRHAALAPLLTQDRAAQMGRRLGLRRCPNVWLVPGRVSPLLWMPSLLPRRAKLILPIDLFSKLGTKQLDAILAHELAHLQRGDPWVRWLELATIACYWWHPLLSLIRRRLRASEEECCDACVVASLDERKAYATALVETLEFLDGPASPATPALASGAGPVHDLQRRLTMIMSGSTRNRLTRFGVLAILGVAVGALAFGPAFSSAQPEEKKERKGEFKNDKERPVPPREGNKERPVPPRDGEKGNKERPMPPKEFDRERPNPKDGPGGEEIERARQDLERARQDSERALDRVRSAEARLKNLMQDRSPEGPKGPPMGRDFQPNRGNDRQLQEMQKQIEEMRNMLDELRRELKRGPGAGPMGPNFERKDFRRPDESPLPKKNFERRPFDKDDN